MGDQEYDKALGDLRSEFVKLKKDIVSGIFDAQVWAGEDPYGVDRGTPGPPFWQMVAAMVKTNEDQSNKLVRVEENDGEFAASVSVLTAQVSALTAEVAALRAQLAAKG